MCTIYKNFMGSVKKHAKSFENDAEKLRMKKYEDAMIAIGYIVNELKHDGIYDLAMILEDITQVHMHTRSILAEEGQYSDEYQSILYIYFIEKYFNRIKIPSYRNKILDFFRKQTL